jgi:hypothetical protein
MKARVFILGLIIGALCTMGLNKTVFSEPRFLSMNLIDTQNNRHYTENREADRIANSFKERYHNEWVRVIRLCEKQALAKYNIDGRIPRRKDIPDPKINFLSKERSIYKGYHSEYKKCGKKNNLERLEFHSTELTKLREYTSFIVSNVLTDRSMRHYANKQ